MRIFVDADKSIIDYSKFEFMKSQSRMKPRGQEIWFYRYHKV